MPKTPKYFTSKSDARDAFLKDVSEHRNSIAKAFNLYGERLVELAGADFGDVSHRVVCHDLSKCNERVEMIGILAYYYRFPSDELGLECPRRRYLYEKGILNHYHMNSDHPEYWIKIGDNGIFEAMEMDPNSIVECVLDWIAVGYDSGFDPADVFWQKNQGSKLIHKNSAAVIDILIKEFVKMRDIDGIS